MEEENKYYELGIVGEEAKKYKEVSQDIYDRMALLAKCPGLSKRDRRKLNKSEKRDLFNARIMSEAYIELRKEICMQDIEEERAKLNKRIKTMEDQRKESQGKDNKQTDQQNKGQAYSSLSALENSQTKSGEFSAESKEEFEKMQEKKAKSKKATC